MAWIRLSDDYVDHPKFSDLSDGAFRLWHQAMSFCRKYKTDGLIPTATLRKFRAFTAKRQTELQTPWSAGENPLWRPVEGVGVEVHDYLQWNPSKDEETERRAESRDQMRTLRDRRGKGPPSPPPVSTNTVLTPVQQRPPVSAMLREGMGRKEDQEELSAADLPARAGRLLQETYPRLYAKYRHGAKLRLIGNALEFQDALSVVQHWDDARLEKLATLVLTTDDPFISGTDRSFKIFAMKASWADDRLAAWEAEQRGTASAS